MTIAHTTNFANAPMDVKRDIYDPPYEIVPASPGSITIPGDDWAAYVALTVRRVLQTQGGTGAHDEKLKPRGMFNL